ncbi:MAG: oxygenase MpaB family protein [Ilumatobacteraceae bacterium]|nr:oxygenase MpaB family protein [Ilumatobacteraceae bacterium]
MELLGEASSGVRSMVGGVKNRVVEATTALFSHGPRPLEHTLDHAPDPGLLGPDSVSWKVIGDAAAFVGGIRALVVQTAHPEVVAGVEQHSRYRDDPLGRLTRTSFYVTETTYGAMPEVERAVEMVRHAHRPVHGRSERDRPYSAGHPEMAAWVHNVLTESFLAAYQAYGPTPLTPDEADRFVAEQTRIGALLGADPMPTTAAGLTAWVCDHPALAATDDLRSAMEFLRDPPLSIPVKIGYAPLFNAAVATLPERILDITGLRPRWRSREIGRAATNSLRWALGSSPSWHVSLIRADAPVPDGLFRQPLSAEAKELLASRRTAVAG